MADGRGTQEPAEGFVDGWDLTSLPAASSLMSCRWSTDNLVTSDPLRLYCGGVLTQLSTNDLELLLSELQKRRGGIETGAARMGVLTWDLVCRDQSGPFVLQLPRDLDEAGRDGRKKAELPHLNALNLQYFIDSGFDRFLSPPLETLLLQKSVKVALLAGLPDHHPLSCGRGSLQLELYEGEESWLIALGPQCTADLLAEVIACLVYHYEPEIDGGTAITDVVFNDGDFVVKRRADASFDLRLTTIRRRQSGIGPNLLLLYLIQLMGYEDWAIEGVLSGLPLLISNPSVTFEGVLRGLRYRYEDSGRSRNQATIDARRWIEEFGRSSEGYSYRPWTEAYLGGKLPLSFGDDPRECWWRRFPVKKRLGLVELRSRYQPSDQLQASAKGIRTFLDKLSREIGRLPTSQSFSTNLNDLDATGLSALLGELGVPSAQRDDLCSALFTHWPFRDLDHLLQAVPQARELNHHRRGLTFGQVVSDEDQSTVLSLPSSAVKRDDRPIANPELYASLSLPRAVHAAALLSFPTFEDYMDSALHNEAWGYYAQNVKIGAEGHFTTHPETHSPHYGRWIARWAFKVWQEMIEHQELGRDEAFPVVEFGAGNGRLARDVIDAVAQLVDATAGTLRAEWEHFSTRIEYRIYEVSSSLRERQKSLLGTDATILKGDARGPGEDLNRDFPGGLRGFVVTNELPDAFGFHKVLLTREGRALVALVVPRASEDLLNALGDELFTRVRATNERLCSQLSLPPVEGDFYLDKGRFDELMVRLSSFPSEQKAELYSGLRFRELYVSSNLVPSVSKHLRLNASQYATALAAENSGVILYLNLHANNFIQDLGKNLTAGVILTIDYGDTTWGLVEGARTGDFPFRVYGQKDEYLPRPNDPYAAPGTQDLTADVNFTDLARAGQEVGLQVVHFGWERDIAGDELPELLLRADEAFMGDFLGNPVFKILIQAKRKSELFSGQLLTPLPLFSNGSELPKSRRKMIAKLQEALVSSSSPR